MRLAYGTVQRRATLDYVASRLASRPLASLDAPVLAALRLGLLPLLFLDGVARVFTWYKRVTASPARAKTPAAPATASLSSESS